MIRPIVAYGDPVLKKEAAEVEENHPELSALIATWKPRPLRMARVWRLPKLGCRCACLWRTGRRLVKEKMEIPAAVDSSA